jgi:hypothetical protein
MDDTNHSNAYTFSRSFLMVFIFVSAYALLSVIFGAIMGPLIGSIVFMAVTIGVMSVNSWTDNIMRFINVVSHEGATMLERGINKIVSLFKRATPETTAETAAPAAA